MRATDFEFDGKTLSSFGFILCHFDSGGLETIDGVEVTFNSVPVLNGQKSELISVVYEQNLEATIQICRNPCGGGNMEISPFTFREISRWLSRKSFLKLKFLSDEYVDLYYKAVFTKISRIEIDGKLYGLELTIQTNSPHAFKEPVSITVQTKKLYTWEKYNKNDDGSKGESTGEYITSYNKDAYPENGVKKYTDIDIDTDTEIDVESIHYYVLIKEENVASIFDASHEEGYIYPHTEITILEDGDLNIYNVLEDRNVHISNCTSGEVITMDYPIIKTSSDTHKIQNDFNWNFFRVANTYDNRRNDLTTSVPCRIKIEYSPIVKVGL